MPDPAGPDATLEGWRKIEQAATPGPWEPRAEHGTDPDGEGWSDARIFAADGRPVVLTYLSDVIEPDRSDEDERFIVTARTAFPRLVAALEAVLKLADALTAPAVAADCLDEELAEVRRECATRFREAITRALKGDTDA